MKLKDYPGTSSGLTGSVVEALESGPQSANGCGITESSQPILKMHTENLDDFEQKLLKFTSALQEMCGAALSVTDNEEDITTLCDKVSNILIGMKEYIKQSEASLADDIENHIKKQYEQGVFIGYATVTDDYIIELPPEVIKILGWKEGDTLQWTDLNDGSYKLTKVV